MRQVASTKEPKFTYLDYRNWPEDERWELIDGIPFQMTAAPSVRHQRVTGALYRQFEDFLEDKTCEAFIAPFEVKLPRAGEPVDMIDDIVQPDLTVVCDPAKIDESGCLGTPDLLVEVLSPTSAKRDLREKLRLYEEAGVKEYWVVHPHDKTVMVFTLKENGRYGTPETYDASDRVPVSLWPDFTVDLARVFRQKSPFPNKLF